MSATLFRKLSRLVAAKLPRPCRFTLWTRLRRLTTSAIIVLMTVSAAYAQNASVEPIQRPSRSVISVTTTALKLNGDTYPTFMLRVTSLTGEPVAIATQMWKSGWAAYSSGGKSCDNNRFYTTNLPYLDNGNLRGPEGFTAGVKAAAIIPVTLKCAGGWKRGEEVSMNIIMLAVVNGRWVPQQFSFERLIVQ